MADKSAPPGRSACKQEASRQQKNRQQTEPGNNGSTANAQQQETRAAETGDQAALASYDPYGTSVRTGIRTREGEREGGRGSAAVCTKVGGGCEEAEEGASARYKSEGRSSVVRAPASRSAVGRASHLLRSH